MSQRKLLLPPFHGRRMAGYEETMREIAAREIEGWPTDVPYRLRPRMQAMTLDIIIETVFGVHGGARLEELREALAHWTPDTAAPLAAPGLSAHGQGRALSATWPSPVVRLLTKRSRILSNSGGALGRRRAAGKLCCRCATISAFIPRPLPEMATTTASMPSAEVPDINPTT